MEESGGNKGLQSGEVSLLAEDLIQLSIKSSAVEPSGKPTLINILFWPWEDGTRPSRLWCTTTFAEEDAEKILLILLTRVPHNDFLVWGGEASGDFSVRSAYKLLQISDENPRAYALQTIYRKFYKKLWLLNLPTKIKITIWRFSWNYLPTKVNMQCRKLANNSSCPRCGERSETIDHLFRECPGFLTNSPLVNVGFSVAHSGPYGETREFVKINFDGVFDGPNNLSASGVVVMNEEGLVIISCSETHQRVVSAFAAEAVACRKAVRIGVENNWPAVIIEGDSLWKGEFRSMLRIKYRLSGCVNQIEEFFGG